MSSTALVSSTEAAKSHSDEIEVPEDPCVDEDDDRRLWIGNLGTDITEFSILKLMQKFGKIRKMNFIYHKSGPDKGKSRGYCFVSFHTWEAAEKARKTLDGKVFMSRRLYVKWAHRVKQDELLTSKTKTKPTAASLAAVSSPPPAIAAALSASSSVDAASSETKIKAIEAKLKMMDQTQKDFSLDTTIQPAVGLNSVLHRQDQARSSRPTPYRKSFRPRQRQ
uniref:Probable RNA-binding protein 18 n=1 Tax=Arion vulgaris TaxID=1028688 RepID=A0A0B6ZDU2_9EUPU